MGTLCKWKISDIIFSYVSSFLVEHFFNTVTVFPFCGCVIYQFVSVPSCHLIYGLFQAWGHYKSICYP